MTSLNDIKARLLQVLEDPGGVRFSDGLLEEALRLALNRINQRLPLIQTAEVTVISSSRDQVLDGLKDCLYLINLGLLRPEDSVRELEPGSEFSYQFADGQIQAHFSGRRYPLAGDHLRVTFAASHLLEGLDAALTTTLPSAYESALVIGSAGQACLLRGGRLAESYGTRPNEVTRLMELGQARLDEFERTLSSLGVFQEFGFPPGFRFDAEDTLGSGRSA